MTSELTRIDATGLAKLIRDRQVSPVEVMQAHLDRIAAVNPKLNAIVTIAEGAIDAAREAERTVARGDEVGPLHGVPFTVKDSIDTAGIATQRGSPIFRGRVPKADATVVGRLKAAGGIVIAKTNLPEFSYWFETDNLLTGKANNPWDLARTPGGSSGGEAAIIAAGGSPLGIGSDVAISLRGPAAHTGIVALKATHGRIPMTGLWPQVPRRFWHVGPMARTVRDVYLAYSLLAGPDGLDGYATSPLDLILGLRPDRAVRVGWLIEPGFGTIDPEVGDVIRAAADALATLGCEVQPVRVPALERMDVLDVFWKLQEMEAKPDFRHVTAGREQQLFDYVRAVYNTPDTTITDFVSGEQQIEQLRDGFVDLFQRHDVMLCPVTPISAPIAGQNGYSIGDKTFESLKIMQATVPFNVTGLPALAMRFGTGRDGMPIGIQIVGPWFAETTVLKLAANLEAVSTVREQHPPI